MASTLLEAAEVRVRVPGKINLALKSGPRQPDGYHRLATVFQAVSIFDEVEADWAGPGKFSVAVFGGQAHQVPAGEDNIAVRAAMLLARIHGAGRDLGVELTIRKQIPVAGGMAGGSADAAAALLACSVLWDLDLSPEELLDLGAQLGADVPFCLMGGTALGTGRGDQVVPVLSRGSYHWVLAFSEAELSTPKVFAEFDTMPPPEGPLQVPRELLNALVGGDVMALGRALVNDLQPAAISLRPELADLLGVGAERGAVAGLISGSGPTVAFLTDSEAAAVELSLQIGQTGLCREVQAVVGPVPGARLLA